MLDKWLNWARSLKEPLKAERPCNLSRRGFLRAVGVTASGIFLGGTTSVVGLSVPDVEPRYVTYRFEYRDGLLTQTHGPINDGLSFGLWSATGEDFLVGFASHTDPNVEYDVRVLLDKETSRVGIDALAR